MFIVPNNYLLKSCLSCYNDINQIIIVKRYSSAFANNGGFMKKTEKISLFAGVIFLVLTVLIHVLAVFKYYLFFGNFDLYNNFNFAFPALAIAGLLTFFLCFWLRKSKNQTRFETLAIVIRYVLCVAGSIFVFALIFIQYFVTSLYMPRTYTGNGTYNVAYEFHYEENFLTVYKNVTPFLMKEVYYKEWQDISENMVSVNFKADYVEFSYFVETNNSIKPIHLDEKHYFSEWK